MKSLMLLFLLGLSIIHSQPCSENQIGNLCLTDAEAQACHDHLDNLSAAPEDNPSIDNTCSPLVVNDVQRYNFIVNYNSPYSHNANCVTQSISFQGIDLNEGTGDLNEWQFDPVTQQITFDILHSDLENVYGCLKITNDDEYIWQCDMALHIYFGGIEQLTYGFHMVTTLARDYTNTLTVNVLKNQVIGDCCENTLNIVTSLHFCTSYACDNYLPDGLTVQRKQDIYVEHRIDSVEFQYYFLHGLQIKLGAFVPDIIKWNGSQAGRLIYHFQSNIAMPNLVLEVISRISEVSAGTGRRALQQQQNIGDDYKIKATGNITVEEISKAKKEETKKEKSDNTVLLAVAISLGCIVLLSLIGTTFYCIKVKKSKNNVSSAQKYQMNSKEVEQC